MKEKDDDDDDDKEEEEEEEEEERMIGLLSVITLLYLSIEFFMKTCNKIFLSVNLLAKNDM
jgi:hypothetical protein